GMKPPGLATPMTSARAPAALASAGVIAGSPVLTVAPAQANSPMQRARAQSRRPNAVLAYTGSSMSPRNSRYGQGSASACGSLSTQNRSSTSMPKVRGWIGAARRWWVTPVSAPVTAPSVEYARSSVAFFTEPRSVQLALENAAYRSSTPQLPMVSGGVR